MAAAGSATGCVNPRSKNKVVPSSLLENVDADKPLSRRYSLGIDEFVDKSAYEKENRPLSLSLGRKKKAKASTLVNVRAHRDLNSVKMKLTERCLFSMSPREREIEGGFPFHKLTYQRIRPSLNCNVAVRACQHPRFRAVTTALPCFWIVGSHIQSPIQQPPSSSYCTAVLPGATRSIA